MNPLNSPTSKEYVGKWGFSYLNADSIFTNPMMADCGVFGFSNLSPHGRTEHSGNIYQEDVFRA